MPTTGHCRWLALVAVAVAMVMVLCPPVALADQRQTVHLYEGEPRNGVLESITAASVNLRSADAAVVEIPRAKVRRIVWSAPPQSPQSPQAPPPTPLVASALREPGQHVILLDDGSMLAIASMRLDGADLQVGTSFLPRVNISSERVVRVLRPMAGQTADDVDAMRRSRNLKRGEQDQLLIAAGDDHSLVAGILEAMDERQLVLSYEGVPSPLALHRVRLIEMAQLAPPPVVKPIGHVRLRDGSRLSFTAGRVTDDRLIIEHPVLSRVTLPMAQVVAVDMVSDRVAALGDLTPTAMRQVPYFSSVATPRVDASIQGQPLRLVEGDTQRTFEQGVAFEARTQVTYALDQQYVRLLAVAGIDADLEVGAAMLTIKVDGRVVVDGVLLDRAGQPRELAIDLADAKELVILVDFAPDRLGVGARVHLADALLIRP